MWLSVELLLALCRVVLWELPFQLIFPLLLLLTPPALSRLLILELILS